MFSIRRDSEVFKFETRIQALFMEGELKSDHYKDFGTMIYEKAIFEEKECLELASFLGGEMTVKLISESDDQDVLESLCELGFKLTVNSKDPIMELTLDAIQQGAFNYNTEIFRDLAKNFAVRAIDFHSDKLSKDAQFEDLGTVLQHELAQKPLQSDAFLTALGEFTIKKNGILDKVGTCEGCEKKFLINGPSHKRKFSTLCSRCMEK